MKIAVLGGYGPGQSVGAVFRAFERAGHDVVHVPTMPEFDERSFPADVDLLFSFKIGLGAVPAGWIRQAAIPAKIFWSFDDPHWIKYHCSNIDWAREHDIVLTSCLASEATYKLKGCRDVFFLPPAMDIEYYRDWRDGERGIDILTSFICTNLYPKREFPDNFVDRTAMIDRLTKTFGTDFHLYGFNPPIEAKPACRGAVSWETTLPEVIRCTKMNIENHAYNRDELYFNERFFQIVSTRRAMFVDRVAGYTDLFGSRDMGFIWYSSLDELVEKLIFFKDKDKLLSDIGSIGFDLMRGWTYDKFVEQVVLAAKCGTPRPSFMR